MDRYQRIQQKKVDSSPELHQRWLQASSVLTRGFGVQKRSAASGLASKAELWDNYQSTKQLNQRGSKWQPIQAKLTIGQPGDKYEQEADSVAERVMAMSEPARVQREELPEEEEELQMKPLAETISPLVQREEFPEEEEELQMKLEDNVVQREELPEEEEELQMKSVDNTIQREELPEEEEELQMKQSSSSTQTATPDLESQLSSSKGGGSPLSDDVRSFMEPRFGADFSGVRVHTGSDAVQMNRDVNAQAFAHGSDIYFGAGKAPGKDALTAHELTHVVQQTGVPQKNIATKWKNFNIDAYKASIFNQATILQRDLPVGPAKDIPNDPGASLERGTFQHSSDQPNYVVRAGGPGRYGDHFFSSSSEAASYALDLATKGEEYIREKSALPPVYANGQPGNPVDYIRVFEVPPKTPYVQSVVGPQVDGSTGKEYKGGGSQVIFPRVELREVLAVQVAAKGKGMTGTPDMTPIIVGGSSPSSQAKMALVQTLIIGGLQALNNISDEIQIGIARTDFFQKLPEIIETLQDMPKNGAKVVMAFLQPVSPSGGAIKGPLRYVGLQWQPALSQTEIISAEKGDLLPANTLIKRVIAWIPPVTHASKSKKEDSTSKQSVVVSSMEDFIRTAYKNDKISEHLQVFLALKKAKPQMSGTEIVVNGKILQTSTPLHEQLLVSIGGILRQRLTASSDLIKQEIEAGEKDLNSYLKEGYFSKLLSTGRDFSLDPHMFDAPKAHEASARISIQDQRFNDAMESLKKGNLNVSINQNTLFRYSHGYNAPSAIAVGD